MNDIDRKAYRPAPKAGEMKCPRCNGPMRPSSKDPKVSACAKCGFTGKRVKLA